MTQSLIKLDPSTSTSADAPARTSRPITPRRVTIAALAALVANLTLFWVATAVGVSFDVESPQPLNALGVGVASVLPIAAAAVVVGLVARRRPTFQRFAAWAGLVFAIVTTAGSFGASGDVPTALTLSAMHLVAGAAWFLATSPRPATSSVRTGGNPGVVGHTRAPGPSAAERDRWPNAR